MRTAVLLDSSFGNSQPVMFVEAYTNVKRLAYIFAIFSLPSSLFCHLLLYFINNFVEKNISSMSFQVRV